MWCHKYKYQIRWKNTVPGKSSSRKNVRKVIIYVFILLEGKTVTEIVCLIDGCVITMLSYKIEGVSALIMYTPLRLNLIYVYLVSV